MKSTEEDPNNKSSNEPCLALVELSKEKEANPQDDGTNNGEIADVSHSKRRLGSRPATSVGKVSKFRKTLKLEYERIRKVVWCCIIIAATSVCLWQMSLRIQFYLKEPTSFQIKIERLHQLQFPAITICPAREPFHDESWRQAFLLPNFLHSPKSRFSMDDIWNEYAVTKDNISVTASCNETNFCNFLDGVNVTVKTSILPTFWGMCFTLSRDTPVTYKGPATYMEIFLRPGPYGRQWFGKNVAAQYFFHDPQTTHRQEAFLRANFWSLGRDTTVHLTLRKFDFLNTSRSPCDDQTTVIECRNKCIDDRLDQIVTCSLPFMSSKWPPCQTAVGAKRTFDEIRNFFYTFNSSDCFCRRQCQEHMYTMNVNTENERPDNGTTIRIQFADNLIESVNEEYAYAFSALVSDIGGCLGIFLGISIISSFKKLETMLHRFKKKE